MSVNKLDKDERAYVDSMLSLLKKKSPSVAEYYKEELENQRSTLKLIASENYSSPAVQAALGSIFTDKYAEGYPFHRFYAGCEVADKMEDECEKTLLKLFKADDYVANVQPHSGADANLMAYWAILTTKVTDEFLEKLGEKNISNLTAEDFTKLRELSHNQRLLALDYYSGGHLTHGYRQNISSQIFNSYSYSVNSDSLLLDYDEIEKKAKEVKPLIILAGYSAYPRLIDFRKMKKIADEVGSVLMVDMAHFAGLVAGEVLTGDYSPVGFADVITSTTHKTLRGPRGGFILAKKEFENGLRKGCPLVIGGPLEHCIAAKLVAFKEALEPSFKEYAKQIVKNSRALADEFNKKGLTVVTGSSDNHIVLLDVFKSFKLTGRQAESSLRSVGVTLNRNAIYGDVNGPWYTSALRLGTAALTTRGMKEGEMKTIADIISKVLSATTAKEIVKDGKKIHSKSEFVLPSAVASEARKEVETLLGSFPLYS